MIVKLGYEASWPRGVQAVFANEWWGNTGSGRARRVTRNANRGEGECAGEKCSLARWMNAQR